jgi:hypothetical protein
LIEGASGGVYVGVDVITGTGPGLGPRAPAKSPTSTAATLTTRTNMPIRIDFSLTENLDQITRALLDIA